MPVWRRSGGRHSFLQGRSAPRSNSLPSRIPFWQKTFSFHTSFTEKGTPFTHQFKNTTSVFWSLGVKEQYGRPSEGMPTKKSKYYSSSPGCGRNHSFTSTCEIPSLLYTWSKGRYLSPAQPPCIAHPRRYPLGCCSRRWTELTNLLPRLFKGWVTLSTG